jgi:hypothetical protein
VLKSNFAHSVAGIFLFDLPIGLLITFIFHNIVRDRLFVNLPIILKLRLIKFIDFNWRQYFKKHWIAVVTSLLVGAASHIFWDGFTHPHGYFVEMISGLRKVTEIQGNRIPLYRILQHLSTVVGGIVIAFALSKITPDHKVVGRIDFRYWAIAILITASITTIRIAVAGADLRNYGQSIVTFISAGLISLIVTPVLLELNMSKVNKR